MNMSKKTKQFFLVILILNFSIFNSCSEKKVTTTEKKSITEAENNSKIQNNQIEQNKNLTIEDGVLIIGTEYGYPPFEYLDKDGKTLIGFDVDLWKELCMRLNLKPKVYDTQWSGLFASLETNRYDCVISAVTITKERQKRFLITKPYIQNSQCFVVRKDFEKILKNESMLKRLKVAYQAETVSDVFVTNLVKKRIKMKTFEYDKLMDAFDDLKFKRVQVVVAESVAARSIVKQNPDLFRIDFIGEPDAYFGILVSKKNQLLFEKIQATIDSMYADGVMKSLEEKWLQ